MISIDNDGHIIRNETKENQEEIVEVISIDEYDKIAGNDTWDSSAAARKRKEIAERLKGEAVVDVSLEKSLFESCENSDPRIYAFHYREGAVALVFLDKGVLKFNWRSHKYYISDSFNRESSVEDIYNRCKKIISVLISLDEAFEGSTLFDFDSETSEQIKISWEKVSNWVSECPIEYSSSPRLRIT